MYVSDVILVAYTGGIEEESKRIQKDFQIYIRGSLPSTASIRGGTTELGKQERKQQEILKKHRK